MLVITSICQNQETYYIFREDGVEVKVTFDDGHLVSDKEILPPERKWFKDGKHLELNQED